VVTEFTTPKGTIFRTTNPNIKSMADILQSNGRDVWMKLHGKGEWMRVQHNRGDLVVFAVPNSDWLIYLLPNGSYNNYGQSFYTNQPSPPPDVTLSGKDGKTYPKQGSQFWNWDRAGVKKDANGNRTLKFTRGDGRQSAIAHVGDVDGKKEWILEDKDGHVFSYDRPNNRFIHRPEMEKARDDGNGDGNVENLVDPKPGSLGNLEVGYCKECAGGDDKKGKPFHDAVFGLIEKLTALGYNVTQKPLEDKKDTGRIYIKDADSKRMLIDNQPEKGDDKSKTWDWGKSNKDTIQTFVDLLPKKTAKNPAGQPKQTGSSVDPSI